MERDGKDIPLVTDLDGTLVAGDTLVEGVKDLLARRPWMCCVLPFWVARGRRFFKKQLAPGSAAACLRMPLNASVADLLGEAARTGRRVCLATAAYEEVAEAMRVRLPLFDAVFATTSAVNLKGVHKARFLSEMFGRGGFDYFGDSTADLPVWAEARKAYVIGDAALAERVRSLNPEVMCIVPRWTQEPYGVS